MFIYQLDELQILTGIEYLCLVIDRNKVNNHITVFNSPGLDNQVPMVEKIFGKSVEIER